MSKAAALSTLDEVQDYFATCISEWKDKLPALRAWSFNLHITTDPMPEAAAYKARAGAFTEAWAKYEDATINLHLPDDELSISAEDLEETAIHELMHVLISPWNEAFKTALGDRLTETLEDIILIFEEQVCTRLACGFMRTKYPSHPEHTAPPVLAQLNTDEAAK